MSDQTISLELQIDAVNSAKTLSDFNNALTQLKASISSAGEGSAEFNKITDAVTEAEGKVQNLNTSVESMSNLSGKVSSFATVGNQIATGFQSAKSAADLFSSSSMELQKILANVQADAPLSDAELKQEQQKYNTLLKLQTDFSKMSADEYKKYKQDRQAVGLSAGKQEITTDKQLFDAKLSIAQDGLNAVTSLGNLFITNQKKLQQFNKDAAVVQLGIDTAKSISTTIASATEAASAGGPAVPFLVASYIASGIATVLGAFAKAKSLLGDSSSTASPTLSAASSVAPSLQPAALSTPITNLQYQSNNTSQQQPLKVFVTESDIRTATNRIDTIMGRAVIR